MTNPASKTLVLVYALAFANSVVAALVTFGVEITPSQTGALTTVINAAGAIVGAYWHVQLHNGTGTPNG